MKRVIFIEIFISFILYSYAWAGENCLENRYVFDIGSGATKSKAYLVNKCEGYIVDIIGEVNIPVKYQDCISTSPDKKTITQECIAQGIDAIKTIEKTYGIDCKYQKCQGVATAWAREAKNSESLLNTFKELNINVKLISQQEEGEIGFKAASTDVLVAESNPDDLIIWDIGGGSFQLTTEQQDGKLYTYEGPWGLFNMLQEIKENLPLSISYTDNPSYFPKQEIPAILRYTTHLVGQGILSDPVIGPKLKKAKIIGMGRILYLGIKYELDLHAQVTKQQLKDLIYVFADLTPQQAKEKYPKLPVHFINHIQQALILVYSIMEGAGMEQIEIIPATLTDYLALDPSLWYTPDTQLVYNSSK